VVGTYKIALESSNLDLTAGYNHNKTEIEKVADNPAALVAIDPLAVRIGRAEIGRITQGSPNDKFFLGATWLPGNWAFNATTTRWGEFSTFGTTASADQVYGAEWTLDLSATYKLDNWSFTLGGDNVLDEYPDESVAGAGTRNYLPYAANSPFGFNGAFMYANVSFKW
jgi:iron complex outermembrane receptor protein